MKWWKQPQVKAFGKWAHEMIDSSPSCESNRQNVTGAACVPVGKKVAEWGGCQRAQQGDAASLEMNASFDLLLFFFLPPQQRAIHLSLHLLAIYMRARPKITVCLLCPRLGAGAAADWSQCK